MNNDIDIEQLRFISLSLINSVKSFKQRQVVEMILFSLKTKPRIKLLRGFRGVGKTTALLQACNQDPTHSLYFSADHPSVKNAGIYKCGAVAVVRGYSKLFIDEIHTYPNWKTELKALHDEFPNVMIIASGSAPLALTPERREELICLHEMNLYESNLLRYGQSVEADEEWQDKDKSIHFVAVNAGLEADFQTYIRTGGFPLSLEMDEKRALNAIFHSIRKSVREDAVFFLKMSKEKIFAMENLLIFLATSKPGELSANSLASALHVSKTVIYEIIDALSMMEIIRLIRPYAGGAALVRAEPKLLFFHPNMRFAICNQLGKTPELGAIREELAVFGFNERGWTIHTVKGEKKSPDYIIEKDGTRFVIEIGGIRKKPLQLQGFKSGLIISEYQLIPLLMVAKSSKIE